MSGFRALIKMKKESNMRPDRILMLLWYLTLMVYIPSYRINSYNPTHPLFPSSYIEHATTPPNLHITHNTLSLSLTRRKPSHNPLLQPHIRLDILRRHTPLHQRQNPTYRRSVDEPSTGM